jgi:hypothetical protein
MKTGASYSERESVIIVNGGGGGRHISVRLGIRWKCHRSLECRQKSRFIGTERQKTPEAQQRLSSFLQSSS